MQQKDVVMNPKSEKYKTILEKRLSELQQESAMMEAQDPYKRESYVDENTQDDDASEREEHTRVEALTTNLKNHVKQVEDALARIEKGVYGTCLNCKQPIDQARLDILPEAELCIDCQRKSN